MLKNYPKQSNFNTFPSTRNFQMLESNIKTLKTSL